ncbi:hypothetical protein ABFS82_07G068500 [Erythranthe guttata]
MDPPDVSPVAAGIRQESSIGSPQILNGCDMRPDELSGPRCPSFGSSATDSWPSGMRTKFKEKELVTIKVKTPKGKIEEEVKKIPKEEAICKFCFHIYTDDMLETKCKCKFSMIHQPCAVEWFQKKGNNKCDVCEENIQNISIVVSWDHMASARTTNNKEQYNGYSTSGRFWRKNCCFNI